MEITQKPALVAVYRRYGFHLARDRASDGYLVFTLKTGYFDNAEIVKISPSADTKAVFEEFTRTGYACTVREAASPDQTEKELFRGFFSVVSTRQRLLDDYHRFASTIIKAYGAGARYEYIKAPYEVNGQQGELSPPEEVVRRIDDPHPILFLIEAAAGFGKTCTALEIVRLLADDDDHLPLYAELSRNRQARIFRYILLDEIDRTFPLLSSGLVQTEIRNGRVATILDGFDELLRKNEDTGEFENKEPMLETVSELLTGSAKVIITTRRTVLFDGDEFHQWLDRHAGNFHVVRIRIQEPRIEDWLSTDRRETLAEAGIRIENMANPVLLSYLRCVDDETFSEAAQRPEEIVDSYFTYMLEREKERQDLRMPTHAQDTVLKLVARDMMDHGYTAETREYIISQILTANSRLIDDTRGEYPSSARPSREEIANKLASHALLDRSAQDPDKISFINEFALGHYVASNIIELPDWLNDDMRFIDPAVRAYKPRAEASRMRLYQRLTEVLEYVDTGSKIEIAAELTSRIPFRLESSEADGLSLEGVHIGEERLESFLFNDCTFRQCYFQVESLAEVTFLNCRFYDCVVSGTHAGPVYVLGGLSLPDISTELQRNEAAGSNGQPVNPDREVDLAILRRLWPIGETFRQRPSRPIYKPMKLLCTPTALYTAPQLFASIDRLKKLGILMEMNRSGLVTVNPEAGKAILELAGDEV